MINKYNFICSECPQQITRSIHDIKNKPICKNCDLYKSRCIEFVEFCKQNIIEQDRTIQNTIKLCGLLNTITNNLRIQHIKNQKYFEQIFEIVSNDYNREHDYMKLKYDVYIECWRTYYDGEQRREQHYQDELQKHTRYKPTKEKPTDIEIMHENIMNVIPNYMEYQNFTEQPIISTEEIVVQIQKCKENEDKNVNISKMSNEQIRSYYENLPTVI
jgi:hypothetical protein